MGYAYQNYDKENMARAKGSSLRVSLKYSVEVAREIKGKKLTSAINFLQRVVEKKQVVPYRRYFSEVAHKRGKGIDTGGYPVSVSEMFLKLLFNAKKNASEKEISEPIYVISVSSRKGSQRPHQGRYSGRMKKSTHLELVVGNKVKKEKVVKNLKVKND